LSPPSVWTTVERRLRPHTTLGSPGTLSQLPCGSLIFYSFYCSSLFALPLSTSRILTTLLSASVFLRHDQIDLPLPPFVILKPVFFFLRIPIPHPCFRSCSVFSLNLILSFFGPCLTSSWSYPDYDFSFRRLNRHPFFSHFANRQPAVKKNLFFCSFSASER